MSIVPRKQNVPNVESLATTSFRLQPALRLKHARSAFAVTADEQLRERPKTKRPGTTALSLFDLGTKVNSEQLRPAPFDISPRVTYNPASGARYCCANTHLLTADPMLRR